MRYAKLLVLLLLVPFLGGAVNSKGNNVFRTYTNDTSTGTTQYFLAKVVTATTEAKAIKAGTGDTQIPLALVQSTQGITGTASLVWVGEAPCFFDAVNASGVGGQPVVASTTTAGKCHTQASPPASGMVLGYMISDSTSTTAGVTSQVMFMNQPFIPGSGSGTGTVNTGNDKALACYSGTGTTVDDCVQIGAAGRYPKSNGTDFTLSTMGAGGVGACTNQAVTALNADAVPTCTTLTSAYVNNTIALTGTDINTSSEVTGANGTFSFKGDVSPGTLGGNLNDYSGCDGMVVCNFNGGTADRIISGFANGTDGRLLVVRNVGTTNSLVLPHQSTSSGAANRLALIGSVTIPPGGTYALVYNTAASLNRWVPWQNAMLDAYAVRKCEIDNGSLAATATALVDDDDIVTTCGNDYGKPWTLTGFACKVNAGSIVVLPVLTGGGTILTGNVTCGTTWTAGTISGTPTLQPFNADGATCPTTPCTADLNTVSVDGTAKRVQMKLIGTLQK